MTVAPDAALSDVRVLDLADEIGIYCTKLLADLGADVIRVEPPHGHPMRRIGPFYQDDPDPEKSLLHFLMNANKRGVTLDLNHPDGRQVFEAMVRTSDVVVESHAPGYLSSLGLGYEQLKSLKPDIIVASITPFGQTGPYRQWKGPSIVGDAAGGLMYVSGHPDGPPLVSGGGQSYYMAGLHAAVGTLLALYNHDRTGIGEWIDVSMQEAVATTVQPQAMFWPAKREVPRRNGHGPRTRADSILRDSVHRCKDGWVTGLGAQERGWSATLEWLEEEGAAADLADPKYQDPDQRVKDRAHVHQVLADFAAERSMQQLMEDGQRRHLFVMPMFTAREIAQDPHLKARGFFTTVEHPELGQSLVYPGAPYLLSETPWSIRRRAPRIGEHNHAIYHTELGISTERLTLLEAEGAI